MTSGPNNRRRSSNASAALRGAQSGRRIRQLLVGTRSTEFNRPPKRPGQVTLSMLDAQLRPFNPRAIRDGVIQTLDASSDSYQNTVAWRGDFGAALLINNVQDADEDTLAELQRDLVQLKENADLFGADRAVPLSEIYIQVADAADDSQAIARSIQAALGDDNRQYTLTPLSGGRYKLLLPTPIDINKQLKSEKLEKVLGTLDVRNQREIGAALSENSLPAFLAGLAQTRVSSLPRFFNSTTTKVLKDAQSSMRKALSRLGEPKTPPWVSESQLRQLFNSPNAANREAGEQVMATLLEVSKYPSIINKGVESGGIAPLIENLQGDRPLDKTQIQTGVIKWMRSRLTIVYFESALIADLNQAVGPAMLPDNRNISSYIANVGFNRLMSGNNLFGASLSSDVDFKLVFDDEQLALDLNAADLRDPRIENVRREIKGVLEGAQAKFERNFPLTLEVEAFTVKSLSQLAVEARDNTTERNFLATVLNNQTFMSGNPDVQKKFKAIIQREVGLEIARRTWTQNLGESDKGSMEIIKALPEFEQILPAISSAIAGDAELSRIVQQIIAPGEPVLPNAVLNPAFIRFPETVKQLLANDTISRRLAEMPAVVRALDSVRMFSSDRSVEGMMRKLKLLSKLMLNFTENGRRNFIGRPNLPPENGWVYSVKFAGCRLFDTFDQMTLENYQQNRPQDDRDPVETYNSGKQVAIAINKFAIQMQNRIYEYYGLGVEAGRTHADIDTLYPRLTSEEFSAMLNEPSLRAKINVMMTDLLNDLGESPNATEPRLPDSLRGMIAPFFIQLNAAVESIQNDDDTDQNQPEALGFLLFDALFKIANHTARSLQPASPD